MRLRLIFLAAVLLALIFQQMNSSGQADESKNGAPAGPEGNQATFSDTIAPFLAKYCTSCHGGAKPKGGLALDKFGDEGAIGKNRKVWQEMMERVRNLEMPPPERKVRPSAAEIERITTWVGARLKASAPKNQDPGRVTLRRLNRAEYNNTIRDLFGLPLQPADDFPSDDVGYGFDNIGDVLSMSPILMEKYLAAAEKIVAQVFQKAQIRDRLLDKSPGDRNPKARARRILESFATRAFRRPVEKEEMRRLMELVDLALNNGDDFETGMKVALEAILVSPQFLFRVELDRGTSDANDAFLINEYELASRLSYFLWSSMPDETLLNLAREGKLRNELTAQARRMLADPKAKALVENFAGQWLQTRNLKTVTPDTGCFPTFDEALRSAMLTETNLFFEALVKEDRSILEFLDTDFTFVNEKLARHYGIPDVKGDQFRRVSLKGTPRGGVLTMGSVLTVTSNPTRTSPVKRGKYILENILGTPPPPPPPDAGELSEDKKVVLSNSLRKRMEQHRSNPNCASCHQRMDPLGFGFENFDAVGAWRDKDGQFPIDPSGTLPSGQSFKGPRELKAILKGKDDAFRKCLTEKMLTYALGRGMEESDAWAIDRIAGEVAKKQNKFSSLVVEIAHSDLFQKRRSSRGKS
jgi:hypothetical protein